MKQPLKIIAILASMIYLEDSRADASPELDIALKGGLNAATLEHDNRENRYGPSGGIATHLQWLLTDRFSLGAQAELLYTPRGAEVVVDNMKQGESRQHYIDLMFAMRPETRLGSLGAYLLLGGGLNFLMSANKNNISGSMEDITGDLHRLDIALLAGLGVALHLGRREQGTFHLDTVFLEARHDIGLLDTDAVNGGFKNRTSSVMLGLSFALGGSSGPVAAAE